MCNLYPILVEYQGLYKLSLIFRATILKQEIANVTQLTKTDSENGVLYTRTASKAWNETSKMTELKVLSNLVRLI